MSQKQSPSKKNAISLNDFLKVIFASDKIKTLKEAEKYIEDLFARYYTNTRNMIDQLIPTTNGHLSPVSEPHDTEEIKKCDGLDYLNKSKLIGRLGPLKTTLLRREVFGDSTLDGMIV